MIDDKEVKKAENALRYAAVEYSRTAVETIPTPEMLKAAVEKLTAAARVYVATLLLQSMAQGATAPQKLAMATDTTTCLFIDHSRCRVVVGEAPSSNLMTLVCMCDCKDCRRAWFADGQPIVREGKIVRKSL